MARQPVSLDLLRGDDLQIQPGRLILDPGNLRFHDLGSAVKNTRIEHYAEPSTQRHLRELLSDPRYKLESLVKSIRTNGFLEHERLIVAPFDGHHYLVLEG